MDPSPLNFTAATTPSTAGALANSTPQSNLPGAPHVFAGMMDALAAGPAMPGADASVAAASAKNSAASSESSTADPLLTTTPSMELMIYLSLAVQNAGPQLAAIPISPGPAAHITAPSEAPAPALQARPNSTPRIEIAAITNGYHLKNAPETASSPIQAAVEQAALRLAVVGETQLVKSDATPASSVATSIPVQSVPKLSVIAGEVPLSNAGQAAAQLSAPAQPTPAFSADTNGNASFPAAGLILPLQTSSTRDLSDPASPITVEVRNVIETAPAQAAVQAQEPVSGSEDRTGEPVQATDPKQPDTDQVQPQDERSQTRAPGKSSPDVWTNNKAVQTVSQSLEIASPEIIRSDKSVTLLPFAGQTASLAKASVISASNSAPQPAVTNASLPAPTAPEAASPDSSPASGLTLAATVFKSSVAGNDPAGQTELNRPLDGDAATTRPTMTLPLERSITGSHSGASASGDGREQHSPDRKSSSDAEPAPVALNPSHRTENAVAAVPVDEPKQSTQDRVRVVSQITDKIESMRLTQGRQEVVLHLKPEHLGDLRVSLTADRELINARIQTESTVVRQAVEEGKDHLRQALEQKGFTLQGLDVTLGQGRPDQRFQPFVPQQAAPGRFTPIRETLPDAAATVEAVARPRALSAGHLDYHA